MTDYTKLVAALRCKRDDCEGCGLAFFDKDEGWMCQYAAKDDDAADAIEALQAQLPKRGEIVRCRECKHYVIAQLKSDYTEDKRYSPSVCVKGRFAVPHKPDWFCADGERKVQE